jgi:hypothetical protein
MTQPSGGIFRVKAGSRGLPTAHILWLAFRMRGADAARCGSLKLEPSRSFGHVPWLQNCTGAMVLTTIPANDLSRPLSAPPARRGRRIQGGHAFVSPPVGSRAIRAARRRTGATSQRRPDFRTPCDTRGQRLASELRNAGTHVGTCTG